MAFWIPLLADNMDQAIKERKFANHAGAADLAYKILKEALKGSMKNLSLGAVIAESSLKVVVRSVKQG